MLLVIGESTFKQIPETHFNQLHKLFLLNCFSNYLKGGESTLGIPESINFGMIVGDDVDLTGVRLEGPAPFRTIVMLISLTIHFLISWTTHILFTTKRLSLDLDFFNCFETR